MAIFHQLLNSTVVFFCFTCLIPNRFKSGVPTVTVEQSFIAVDKLLKELKKPGDDPLNLSDYQAALATITSSRGKATRRLVYDTFLRFFNGASTQLEWLDTAAQITGATS